MRERERERWRQQGQNRNNNNLLEKGFALHDEILFLTVLPLQVNEG